MHGAMTPRYHHQFDNSKAAFFGGIRESVGTPSFVLAVSYLGFGSLLHQSNWSLWIGLLSTLTTWALPGQIVMVEFYQTGSAAIVIALAVGLTNARLLPMVVSLLPVIRHPNWPRWTHFPISHLIAVTSWINVLSRSPTLPGEHRIPYFLGFALFLWCTSMTATAIGYYMAGVLPQPVTLGLVFFNPLYFLLIPLLGLQSNVRLLAILFGGVLGPALYLVTPDWGLLLTGLAGGTAAFFIGRKLDGRRRHVEGGDA